jgi:hypothetical protein
MTDNPFNIKTQAGQRLWTYLNNQHGAGTWGLAGELIPLIEKETQERIIALLTDTYGEDYVDLGVVGQIVSLIKGEGQDPLRELQRLSEATGEHENFDNPLIK